MRQLNFGASGCAFPGAAENARKMTPAVFWRAKRLAAVNGALGVVVILVVVSQRDWDGDEKLVKVTETSGSNEIPGGFLRESFGGNESYCKFMYDLPWGWRFDEEDAMKTPGGRYAVLYNVVRGENGENGTLPTYCTHLTPEFTPFLSEVVRTWEGPVSVAAFVPDSDASLFMEQLWGLCWCLSDMSRLSVHFVFPQDHPPRIESVLTPNPPCRRRTVDADATFRRRSRLPYPVNACRNVARTATSTQYLLVSDVELIPSKGLASRFMGITIPNRFQKKVFVVPVFEIEKHQTIPDTKKELLKLVHTEKSVYFHRHLCLHCQKFPGIEHWLQEDPGDVIEIFGAATRTYPYHRWEPIYIGTKNEPLYSEQLSWEGKQDKMTQMLEMCLMGYRFLILDGGFLVHWPGIKRKSAETKRKNLWRSPYQLTNSRQYSNISKRLEKQYPRNQKCRL